MSRSVQSRRRPIGSIPSGRCPARRDAALQVYQFRDTGSKHVAADAPAKRHFLGPAPLGTAAAGFGAPGSKPTWSANQRCNPKAS